MKTALRKGVYKSYIRNSYNDTNINGIIDVARHIKANTPFIGNVAYNQFEFSFDNDMTQLIRHTIEFIKTKPMGRQFLETIRDEIDLIKKATSNYELYDRRKIIHKNKTNPIKYAYYHEYRILQHLCISILQNDKHQFGVGGRQIYGILFDCAWLWEEYVNSLIGDMFYHPKNKGNEGCQQLFASSIGRIYPDFISRNAPPRVIADAKYKPTDNIGNKDYLQVLAYMFRFDSKKGLYLYPESGTGTITELKLNLGVSYEKNVAPREDTTVIKLGLKIPTTASKHDDFVTKIRASENNFIETISRQFCECSKKE